LVLVSALALVVSASVGAAAWVRFVQGVVIFLAVLVDALNRRRESRAT
jgi:ribose/xylose/arabinose/galactoside ABC-type transport system permease subunit